MANRLLIEQLSDGQVSVSFRRDGQEFDEVSGKPIAFASPLGRTEREDLRWYFKDYLLAPYAVYEDRGQAIRAKLGEWDRALFDSVFGSGKPGRDAYLKAHEGACALVLRSPSPEFMGLPWELIHDPERQTPLALDLRAIDRTLQAAGAAAPIPPGKTLRVLMVIARPSGLKDVGYQMIARPLMERLGAVRGEVALEVLRPPTFEAMRQRLKAAADLGEPFHILHFDGHGTFAAATGGGGGSGLKYDAGKASGYLVFEPEGGGDDFVSADKFALAVSQGRVPLVVMNACQSGMLGEAAVEAAVATRVLEGGASSVVAMGYSVYALAAAEFMAAFYEALFAGQAVSEAVSEGRRRLYDRQDRPSPKGLLPLEDWMVPVHYLRRSIGFAELKASRPVAAPSLDKLLDRLGPRAPQPVGAEPPSEQKDPLAPVGRFVGRDAAFYTLELALKWQRVVVVHGPAGTGKTELAKAFGRWWRDTGGIDNPGFVFFHSFEPGLASFGLDGVVTEIGLRLFGSDFLGQTRDAAHRRQVVQELLCEHRLLLLWDNFESVCTLPDPTGATPPLDETARQQMRDFLHAVAQNGKSGVIITSRTKEDWLGEVRRVELGGLRPPEAAEMAENELRPYPTGRTRRKERAFAELLEWLDGHPLSIHLLLPHLEQISAAGLLTALKGQTQNLPPGFVGEGRTESLGASLKYSFDHVPSEMRLRAVALALFEGVAFWGVLREFSQTEGVPGRFAGLTGEDWSALLARLASIGVLTALGGGMYGLHPALPSYLTAEWRVLAGGGFAAEKEAAEGALLAAYAEFGDWLDGQIQGGAAEVAFALLERQRRTMGRLLGFALGRGRYAEAQSMLCPLNQFWEVRGLRQEARGWLNRFRTALEDRQGSPPDLSSEAGALWLFAVGNEADRAMFAGDLEVADRTYDEIRRKLEASAVQPKQQRMLATAYHKLGMVAQDRGDLGAAEGWYRKSLGFGEALGDRLMMAGNYHELGVMAQDRGDLGSGEAWHRKSLEIMEALGNRSWMASSYHQLGMVAQDRGDLGAADGWYRKSLEIGEALGDRPRMALDYHELGITAQHRGDLTAAEGWYRKSLEIKEALGDRPRMASTYCQLGLLAEARDRPEAAFDWMVCCVALFPKFPHPATGSGAHNLARLTEFFGLPALEESWKRCTGAELPDDIRAAVITMIELV